MRSPSSFAWAATGAIVAIVLAACAVNSAGPHPHDHVLGDDFTYEKNAEVRLKREYWIIAVGKDGKRAMLPRPDGDPRIVAECESGGSMAAFFANAQLCTSATASTLARVNGLSADEARRVSTFLHERLKFTAAEHDVEPHALTTDILDICKMFPAERNGVLRSICDEEFHFENANARPAIARNYSADEIRAIADRLNDLYGIP